MQNFTDKNAASIAIPKNIILKKNEQVHYVPVQLL